MLAAATIGHASIVKSILEFAHKTAYPEAGLYEALRNGHDEVADVLVRQEVSESEQEVNALLHLLGRSDA